MSIEIEDGKVTVMSRLYGSIIDYKTNRVECHWVLGCAAMVDQKKDVPIPTAQCDMRELTAHLREVLLTQEGIAREAV